MPMLEPAQPQPSRRADWIAAVLVVIFVISGILTLPEYGMTWDEGLGNFFFGERYLNFFLTFQPKYLNFEADLPELNQPQRLYLFNSLRDHPHEFPALMDTISAGAMYLLAYDFEWMDPVDAYHFLKVLLAGILLWFLYRFSSRRLGGVAALAALAFLATFPRFWGDMHFNPKDIPETVLFSLTIFAFWRWTEKPSWRWVVATGLASGAAVAVKANAVFLPFVLGPALLPLAGQLVHWHTAWRKWLVLGFQMGVMGVIALSLYIASWPYLYINTDLITGLKRYWRYIFNQGHRTGLPVWNPQPIQMVIATLPEWMMVFVVLGLAVAVIQFARTRKPVYSLLLAWFLVPLVRISMPGAVNFNGIRHFLEFIPAAALLAGLAAGWLVEQAGKFQRNGAAAMAGILLAGILINAAYNFVAFGRYQHLYFNAWVGGFPGGGRIFGVGEDTDYWAGSYRQAITWLNAHADGSSLVSAPVCSFLLDSTGPLWLRPDIKPIAEEALPKALSEYKPVYLMLLKYPNYYSDLTLQLIETRQPVHNVSLQGVPLVMIYQVSP